MNANVLFAVFKRNFTSYFASPLGYVFILVFVGLSTGFAILSPEFFNVNLANLDQLNRVFPFIMLIFIPAITMAVWSDERRQGTDELILTLPASDWDIVAGKYLSAVAIFSVSLVYSLACNFTVLKVLGNPDFGLLLGTYFGYWLIGLAMLAVGMTASFLTGNLTVAFILGSLFNLPLVILMFADTVPGLLRVGQAVKAWSIAEQFRDFGRGVITLSGTVYFVAIAATALYVSMILIGRRHWFTGEQRHALVGHYAIRAVALLALVVGLNALCSRHDIRWDVTSERLSSLSPLTRDMLAKIDPKQPIVIEAFISPNVPEPFVQTRLNLLNTLRELEGRAGGKIRLRIHDTERFTDTAARAQQLHGIEPRRVTYTQRGAWSEDQIFMHVAVSSGLKKVGPVFFDRGIPVEYELVRSIGTMAAEKRKKLGIVNTGVPLFGQFDFMSMSPGSDWPIIDELRKQYEVEQIDLSRDVEGTYDAVLAVQPSMLGPEEMDRFVALVRRGTPTAIFEDPMPVFAQGVAATSAPKQPPGGMNPMMMGMRNLPKGDIGKLWDLLGVEFPADQIVWQNYNPYKRVSWFERERELVFVDAAAGGEFNQDDPISSRLQQLLFPFPGWVRGKNTSTLKVTPLVKTGVQTGTVRYGEIMQMSPFGPRGGLNPMRRRIPDPRPFALAVEITGTVPATDAPAATPPGAPAGGSANLLPSAPGANELFGGKTDDTGAAATSTATGGPAEGGKSNGDKPEEKNTAATGKAASPRENKIHVVLVTDLDMLTQEFFRLREQGDLPEVGVHFDFDNVTFVLNIIDRLAGEDQYIELRKRRPVHRRLSKIDAWTDDARKEADKQRDKFVEDFNEYEKKVRDEIQKKLDELRNRKDIEPMRLLIEVGMMQQDLERRSQVEIERRKQERDREINRIETELNLKIKQVRDRVKVWSILLPPAPLLLLAVGVWLVRRQRETEGVARSRLR